MKEYKLKINTKSFDVKVGDIGEDSTKVAVNVNGTDYLVEISRSDEQPRTPKAAVRKAAPTPSDSPIAAPIPAPTALHSGAKKVTSPLPGVVLGIFVNVGDKVSAGQKVAVVEAMKMENEIQAENSGTVTSVLVHKGDSVLEGATLVTLS